MSNSEDLEPIKIPDFVKNLPEGQEPPRKQNSVFSAGKPVSQNQRSSKLDDVVPDEMCPLPSLGKVYDPDSPLHLRNTVDIRVMTASEENILTNSALIKKGKAITELLKSCLVDKNINVDDLISGDRNAIMVMLRITGYGPEYPIKLECGRCDAENEHTFMLNKLPLRMLEIDPVEPGLNLFKFELPLSKHVVYFKFLTGADEAEISEIQEKMKKKFGAQVDDKSVTTQLKYAIQQVDDVTDKFAIEKFVQNMRAKDSLALRKYMDKNEPTIIMKDTVKCPACDNEEEVGVPITLEFFWPKD